MKFNSRKQQLIGFVGSYLSAIFPKKIDVLKNQAFTLAHMDNNYSLLDQVLRLGLIYKIIKTKNTDELAKYHLRFWQSKGAEEYHKQAESHGAILPSFAHIVDDIKQLIKNSAVQFNTLCEIGSGSGQLLHYLARELTSINHFIGLELNQDTVDRCNKKYGNDTIHFTAADANQWIKQNGQAHWVYISYRGVLEYFPENTLRSLLNHIKTYCSPCILVVIEPIGIHHDLASSNHSEPYSNEFSFSHNYPYLFKEAGFTLHTTKIEPYLPNTNLICLAASASHTI